MIPIARQTDFHSCPTLIHGITPIIPVGGTVSVDGIPVARVGDITGCGAVIVSGFPHILVNDRPMAHKGSLTSHGGTITNGSHDCVGGEVNFMTSKLVVNFGTLGAVRADGSVDEELMAELLSDPKLEERARDAGALVQSSDAPFPQAPEADLPELIAVAGSQHDEAAGNKMMFIGQAVRQLKEYKREHPARPRTLIVFNSGYSEAMIDAARESADLYQAAFKTINTADELIGYINSGKDRQKHPVARFDLFSHGIPLHVSFGYQLEEEATMSLGLHNYQQFSPAAFSPTAKITSFACRTGMGNPQDLEIEGGVQLNPQSEASLAQKLANHLKVPVHAFVTRSDYKNTWGSFMDRREGEICKITSKSLPGEEWCGEWGAAMNERKGSKEKFTSTYQRSGALKPVAPGSSPYGPARGLIEFKPNA
ncbi:hypothetical protein EGJ27_16035 [Pseudomonas sp. v388]|uniref:PAAR domain-containing protein n=1 Tax=Pseudomonas sp. v388 TaxID=2479849 RepID=UPI000F77AA39|nr:PAAR domain-containing protein [Pseudomonas sp. v388]RRV06185.1 hypothetical protein EGJ27_16035 [Pseudomonas sp. v388]